MASKVLKGLGWTGASSLARNIVLVLQISILTRILDKSDFGIIAIANLFITFTSMFLDMGISVGIMHAKELSQRVYSSLFWLNILTGIILTGILFVISPLLTAAYHSDDLTNVVQLLCFTILLNAIGNQQRTVCQKLFYFKRLAIIEIITAIITFGTAYLTAINGYGVYSLAYSTLAGIIFNNVTHLICGILKDNRLTFHFRIQETYSFLKIGVYSIGSSILDFMARELDVIIISSLLGMEFLGVYSVAKKIPVALYGFVNPIMIKVVTPLLAQFNDNISQVRGYFILITRCLAWFSAPLYLLLGALSPTVMYFMFGPEFVDGALVLTVFAIQYAFNSKGCICGSLQTALARTDIGFYWTIYRIISTAIIYYIAAMFGVNWFLFGMLFHLFINIFVGWRIQYYNMIGIKLNEYIESWILPFIIAGTLSIIIGLINFNPSFLYSVCSSAVFVVVYLLLLCKSKERYHMFSVSKQLGIKIPFYKL